MPLLDHRKTAALVASIHQRCHFSEPPFHYVDVWQTVYPHIEVTRKPLPAGVVAMIEVGAGRPVIYYNQAESGPARGQGIIHEFGHYDLHLRNPAGYETRECRRGFRALYDSREEQEAELFVAELLVPLHLLEEMGLPAVLHPTESAEADAFLEVIDHLAKKFDVTSSLMDQRLRDLAAIRQSSIYMR